MASQKITFSSENNQGPCPGVLFGDPKTNPKGLIVLQEWWGLNQQIQDCGKVLSQKGPFVTLVPDLYRGKVTADNEQAGHFMDDLDWKGAIEDIQGAVSYLKSQGVKKVGVTGFCMGGALAMAAAALVKDIDASVPFYGIPSSQLCDVTTIKIPLQCHFASQDKTAGFSTPAEYKPLKTKLEGVLKTFEFYEYDANHAFTNATGPYSDKDCAELAFTRMNEFLLKHLS